MVFQKGHKGFKRKSEDEKMFGMNKNKEQVKTFVDGREVQQQPQQQYQQPPQYQYQQQYQPPIPPAPQNGYVGKGRYAEANMQLPHIPITLLLKVEVSGDIIPILLKIDKDGNVVMG